MAQEKYLVINGQEVKVDPSFFDLSPEEQELEVQHIASQMGQDKKEVAAEEADQSLISKAPVGGVIGAVAGPVVGPKIGTAVDVAAEAAAKKVKGKPITAPRATEGIEKWHAQETTNPFAGGRTKEEAYEKSQRAAGKPTQSRGSEVPIRKGYGFGSLSTPSPEPTLAQKSASLIEQSERLGKPGMARRIGGTAIMGAETGKFIEDVKAGKYGQAAIDALGAAGGAMSQSHIRPVRAIGTLLSAGVPALQYFMPESKEEEKPKEEKAQGGLVYLAGGKAVNEALELVKKTLESGKSGKRLARESEYVHKITPTHQFSEPKKVSIQDLQNSVLVGVPGDRSLTGKMVHEVNAVPLTKPVEQFGGPLYGLQQADLGNPNFWASQKGAASGMQNKAARAMQEHDKPVYGMYAAMAPDASNYALHHLETLLNQVPAMDPAKSQIKGFDKMVREKYPAFAGIMDPDVMQQLKTDSKLRKFIADRMNKTTVADLYGLPSGEATLHAITEPALRDVATGTTGFAVGKLDPFAKLTASKHPTYSTNIPGEFQGQMIAQLPWEAYFPDVAKKIAANPKQAKHSWGTFKMGEFNQPVTQEMVDRIAPIEEFILGKKEGGSTTPAWQRKEGKSPSGGLNALGRASYKRETGGTLKAPQPEGGSRKKSFCARMGGMKKKLTSAKTANDPDSRINKALRKWKC